MRIKIAVLLGLFVTTLSVQAYEKDAYAEPIVHGDFVVNIEALLAKGVVRNGWTLSRVDNDSFNADISHKGYEIKTLITTANNTIAIKLVSVEGHKCNKTCKKSEERVEGWLLRLRRLIGSELGIAARNDVRERLIALNNATEA
jgi:hypothetical protein